MAIFAIVAVTVGAFGSRRDPPKRVWPTWVSDNTVGYLSIMVIEPDGDIRTAQLQCRTKGHVGGGYLASPNARAFACETALVNPTVNDYLTGKDVSGPSCKKTFDRPPPAYVAHFEGHMPQRVNRTLDVANDPCGEALAVIMFPLLESTAEGPSLEGL